MPISISGILCFKVLKNLLILFTGDVRLLTFYPRNYIIKNRFSFKYISIFCVFRNLGDRHKLK